MVAIAVAAMAATAVVSVDTSQQTMGVYQGREPPLKEPPLKQKQQPHLHHHFSPR